MDFRVEVSLWHRQGNGGGHQAAQLDAASDFSDKLGLKIQVKRQEQPGDSARQDGQQDGLLADAPGEKAPLLQDDTAVHQAQAASIQQRQLVPLPGAVELYPLGLQAGRHLSYLPYGFLQNTEQAAQHYEAMAMQQSAQAAKESPAFQQGVVKTETAADAFSPNAHRPVADADANEAILTEQLSFYLAQKWPERSSLLLPRGNGIELLIRDYHLAPDEQESLVNELLVRMYDQPEQPEQIWINGRCIWQRTASLNEQREKGNGY